MSRWTPAINNVGLFLHGRGVVISAAEGLKTSRRGGRKKNTFHQRKEKKNRSKQQRHTWNNAHGALLTKERERKRERKRYQV